MPDFENLHKNHKLAFLDGVLCGIVAAHIARQFYNDYLDMKREKKLGMETYDIKFD